MKKLLYTPALFVILQIFTCCTTKNVDTKVVHSIGNPADQVATISIPGYNDSLRLMQITDTHIDIVNEEEADLLKLGMRMHNAYMNPRKHYSRNISKATTEYFDDLLLKAKEEHIDLLLLTGDIVNFPSVASVNYVLDRLKQTGIPWLFTSGNHDWHYEGMEGSPDSLRNTWISKSITPLYNGLNPLFYSTVIHGINFVAIDNSTEQVSKEQAEFLKEQVDKPEPMILISHIPYNFGTRPDGSPGTDFKNTLLANSDKIIAIISGHVHRTSFYLTGNMCQYTSMAAFQGASFQYNIIAK